MSPKFLLLARMYFKDQKNTNQNYGKTVISHQVITRSPVTLTLELL